MHLKKGLAFLLILSLGIQSFPFEVLAKNSHSNDKKIEKNKDFKEIPDTIQEGNVQTYFYPDGSSHKIYWAKGVKPPKMTTDERKFNTKGYFEKDVVKTKQGDYVTYQVPYEENQGYYDLNKNLVKRPYEENFCYLASAANLLHWWLEQNSEYIDDYLKHLNNDDGVYGQNEELVKILPYSEKAWKAIRTAPNLNLVEGFGYEQEIGKCSLTNTALSSYLSRSDGYFVDMVVDHFVNGYQAIQGDYPAPNNPNQFVTDKRGGYFYPIFGTKPISQRMIGGKYRLYDFYNKNLKNMINDGLGISVAYLFSGGRKAHAITLWGAEYDEKGNLCRIFVTDSDDFYNTSIVKYDYLRGLHSMDVHADKEGLVYLSTNTSPNVQTGTYLDGIVTIDLAQNVWKKALTDIEPALSPEIIIQPKSSNYALNSDAEILKTDAKSKDRGFISYQWYKSDTVDGRGVKIVGENEKNYKPKTNQIGTVYYYCEISNNKNGKKHSVKSDYAKIEVKDIPIVDAERPNINFNPSQKLIIDQYADSIPIYISATVKDGGTISYQWYRGYDSSGKGGSILNGETKNVFYPPTNNPGRYFYYCEVTNTNNDATGKKKNSETTLAKMVIVNKKEIIDAKQPVLIEESINQEYLQDEKASELLINAKSIDGGTISYQWYSSNSMEGNGEEIVGATKSRYLPSTKEVGTKYYYCKVTNTNKDAINKKESSIESRRVKIVIKKNFLIQNPVILEQPQDNHYFQNYKAKGLQVVAKVDDGGKLSYQWYCANGETDKGERIVGATNSVFTPRTNEVGSVYYYCEVTNTVQNLEDKKSVTIVSKRAQISVEKEILISNPLWIEQPKDMHYIQYQEAIPLCVQAVNSDEGNLTYQWYKTDNIFSSGEKIEGAVYKFYIPSTYEIGDTYYYCKVTNTNIFATDRKQISVDSNKAKIVVMNQYSPCFPKKEKKKFYTKDGQMTNAKKTSIKYIEGFVDIPEVELIENTKFQYDDIFLDMKTKNLSKERRKDNLKNNNFILQNDSAILWLILNMNSYFIGIR